MPETQSTIDGQRATPSPQLASATVTCAGGCERAMLRTFLNITPDGLMCDSCVNDLFHTCADCDALLRIDDWGICSDAIIDGEDVARCAPCHQIVYETCVQCGRNHRRSEDNFCDTPDGNRICSSCYESMYYTCAVCRDVHSTSNRYYTPDSQTVCRSCFDATWIECSRCGRIYELEGWDGDLLDRLCRSCFGRADTWRIREWTGSPSRYTRIGSRRQFGVEIETARCDDYQQLHCNTEWGCVYECSTPGREFVSPILKGDGGLTEIANFCRGARERNWTVDGSCGLHIHLDLSGDTSEECLRIAYAYRKTYSMWKKFISNRRAGNSMCGAPQYELADIRRSEHIEDFVEQRDRFEFVNWRAFLRHGSFEVRMYHGSIGAREICNWIKLHARFMDEVKFLSYDEQDDVFGRRINTYWKGTWDLIGDVSLMDYWHRKCSNSRVSGHTFPHITSEGEWDA